MNKIQNQQHYQSIEFLSTSGKYRELTEEITFELVQLLSNNRSLICYQTSAENILNSLCQAQDYRLILSKEKIDQFIKCIESSYLSNDVKYCLILSLIILMRHYIQELKENPHKTDMTIFDFQTFQSVILCQFSDINSELINTNNTQKESSKSKRKFSNNQKKPQTNIDNKNSFSWLSNYSPCLVPFLESYLNNSSLFQLHEIFIILFVYKYFETLTQAINILAPHIENLNEEEEDDEEFEDKDFAIIPLPTNRKSSNPKKSPSPPQSIRTKLEYLQNHIQECNLFYFVKQKEIKNLSNKLSLLLNEFDDPSRLNDSQIFSIGLLFGIIDQYNKQFCGQGKDGHILVNSSELENSLINSLRLSFEKQFNYAKLLKFTPLSSGKSMLFDSSQYLDGVLFDDFPIQLYVDSQSPNPLLLSIQRENQIYYELLQNYLRALVSCTHQCSFSLLTKFLTSQTSDSLFYRLISFLSIIWNINTEKHSNDKYYDDCIIYLLSILLNLCESSFINQKFIEQSNMNIIKDFFSSLTTLSIGNNCTFFRGSQLQNLSVIDLLLIYYYQLYKNIKDDLESTDHNHHNQNNSNKFLDSSAHISSLTSFNSKANDHQIPIRELIISSHIIALIYFLTVEYSIYFPSVNLIDYLQPIREKLPRKSFWSFIRILKAFLTLQIHSNMIFQDVAPFLFMIKQFSTYDIHRNIKPQTIIQNIQTIPQPIQQPIQQPIPQSQPPPSSSFQVLSFSSNTSISPPSPEKIFQAPPSNTYLAPNKIRSPLSHIQYQKSISLSPIPTKFNEVGLSSKKFMLSNKSAILSSPSSSQKSKSPSPKKSPRVEATKIALKPTNIALKRKASSSSSSSSFEPELDLRESISMHKEVTFDNIQKVNSSPNEKESLTVPSSLRCKRKFSTLKTKP